jgi:Tfp pilus assembly protein PilO
MMATSLKRPPLRLILLGSVLVIDLLVAVVGGFSLSGELLNRQDQLEQLRLRLDAQQRSQSEGQAALVSAQQLKDQVAPLVLTAENGLPSRLQLVKAIDAQRLLHDMATLRYRLSGESAEPLAGSSLEQVSRPVEVELNADNQAELAGFWQGLLDKLPGKVKLETAEIEKAAQGVHGQLAFRQLSLRPQGSPGFGADVP